MNTQPIAYYIGSQEHPSRAAIRLFNLLQDIQGHPVDSTVSAQTLRINGVKVPRKLAVGQVVTTILRAKQNKSCAAH